MKSLLRPLLSVGVFSALVAAVPLQVAIAQIAPVKERPLTYAMGARTIDPHAGFTAYYTFVVYNMYDNLYRYRGNPAELKPWLASGHTVSEDGKVWTFTLRDNVVFHDGTPLTAKDVVYSFQRIFGMKSGAAATFAPALKPENIVAVDDKTVRFTLDRAFAPFFTAIPTVSIVNSELVKKNEINGDWGKAWMAGNEAGSGAYQLVEGSYKPDNVFTLRQFDKHFYGWSDNPKAPTVVNALSIVEQSTGLMAVLNGTLDYTNNFTTADEAKRIEAAGGMVLRDEGLRPAIIHINNTKAPLDNGNFRKCLSYAVPYDAIINDMLGGTAKRSPTPIPANMWGNPANPPAYTYDPAKAKEHCDKARAEGAPLDKGVTFVAIAGNEATSLVAQLLQSELQKLGVKMDIQRQPANNLFSMATTREGAPELWMSWISGYYVDPDNFIGQMYDSAFHGTWKASSFYSNPEVDRLLREARLVTRQEDREKLYAKAVELVHVDAPEIWLFNSLDIRGVSKRAAKGYDYSPVSQGTELRWLQIQD